MGGPGLNHPFSSTLFHYPLRTSRLRPGDPKILEYGFESLGGVRLLVQPRCGRLSYAIRISQHQMDVTGPSERLGLES